MKLSYYIKKTYIFLYKSFFETYKYRFGGAYGSRTRFFFLKFLNFILDLFFRRFFLNHSVCLFSGKVFSVYRNIEEENKLLYKDEKTSSPCYRRMPLTDSSFELHIFIISYYLDIVNFYKLAKGLFSTAFLTCEFST